jgi:hypothetical protein
MVLWLVLLVMMDVSLAGVTSHSSSNPYSFGNYILIVTYSITQGIGTIFGEGNFSGYTNSCGQYALFPPSFTSSDMFAVLTDMVSAEGLMNGLETFGPWSVGILTNSFIGENEATCYYLSASAITASMQLVTTDCSSLSQLAAFLCASPLTTDIVSTSFITDLVTVTATQTVTVVTTTTFRSSVTFVWTTAGTSTDTSLTFGTTSSTQTLTQLTTSTIVLQTVIVPTASTQSVTLTDYTGGTLTVYQGTVTTTLLTTTQTISDVTTDTVETFTFCS